MSDTKQVYKAIVEVASAIGRDGISKSRQANQGAGGNYKFRGVDDVMNALSPLLAKANLCILPRVVERTVTERTTKSGTVMSYVVLTVEFDIVSAVDGSAHVVRSVGEAMDSSDKATNKAMSAAYKYACFQAFCIPTEGDNDTENSHHEAVPGSKMVAAPPPNDQEDWLLWAMTWTKKMNAAQTPGAMKEAFEGAAKEARKKNAPAHIVESLVLAKDKLKAQWEIAS